MNKYNLESNVNFKFELLQSLLQNKIKYALSCEHSGGFSHHNYHCGIACSNYKCRVYLYENLNKDLINKIDCHDKTWAIQNLQSNNIENKIVAQYILNNNL